MTSPKDDNSKTAEKAAPAANQPTEKAAPAADQYVVTTDALTLKHGPKATDARRYVRGQRVKVDAKFDDLEYLLSLKAIARHDPENPAKRTTAQMLTRAAGAEDDPVPVPSADVVPTPAEAAAAQQQSQ
jgi:hypothetical protein